MLYSICKGMGIRIREHREKLNYTMEEFAEKLDITPRFVSDIELGKKGMSIDTLIKICELLAVSADYIIWGKGDAPESNMAALTAALSEEELRGAENIVREYVKAVSAVKLQ